MRILVTGGGGFVGRSLVAQLAGRGHDVFVVSRVAPAEPSGETWRQADLLRPGASRELITATRPEVIIHLAWCTEHGAFWESPQNLPWVSASVELLEAFVASGGRRFIGTGTCAEYDWSYGFHDERVTPLGPRTLYGVCKGAFRDVLMTYAHRVDIEAVWARLFFLYGPGESVSRLVPSIVASLRKGEVAKCTPGDQLRDFLMVDDVAEAFVALAEGTSTGCVNVASGVPVSVATVAARIGVLMGKPELIALGALPQREGEPKMIVANTERLNQEFGFRPRESLESGLRRTIDWWVSQPL